MENSRIKTILTAIGVVILVILLASVVYGLIRSFTGDSSDEDNQEATTEEQVEESTDSKETKLEDEASTGEVTMFARGPIVAREDHYEINVVISSNRRSVQVFKGYDKVLIEQDSFANDKEAFTQFLYAAKRAGLFSESDSEANPDGYCYQGELRRYSTSGFTNNVDSWSNSCDQNGTIPNDKYLLKLIKEQFPDYGQYVDQV